MYSAEDYSIALVIYGLAGLGCMLVWWKMTSGVGWRSVREYLRLAMFLLIFTPWYAEDSVQQAHTVAGQDQSVQLMLELGQASSGVLDTQPVYLAPAVAIVAFELLTSSTEAFTRAARPLLTVQVLGLALVFLVAVFRAVFTRARRDPLTGNTH